MRPPWEFGKSLTELGYDMAYIMVYRALPEKETDLRPGDYLTLSRKFAQEHAVTSAIYNGETFAVVRAMVKSADVVGASNPDEYKYQGSQTFRNTKVVNLANDTGELQNARGVGPVGFSRRGMVQRVVTRWEANDS